MPFAPDYSDFLRMKRIQKTIDVDRTLDARKTRSTYAFGSYNPSYQIGYLPANYLPGRLYPPVAPPAPEPPAPGTYTTMGTITLSDKVSTDYLFTIYVEFASGTTTVDFGDGTTQELTSTTEFPHTYPEPAPSSVVNYTIRLTNVENITFLGIITQNLISVDLAPFICLYTFDCITCSNLTSIGTIPDSLNRLNIQNTSVTSIVIPVASALTTIQATDSKLQTISNLKDAPSLETLVISGCKTITTSLSLPPSLVYLYAQNSGITGIAISTRSPSIATINISSSSVASILGVSGALHLRALYMLNIAITDCDGLGTIFNNLPTTSPDTGIVEYTQNVDCGSTGQCGSDPDIECLARSRGWSFSYS